MFSFVTSWFLFSARIAAFLLVGLSGAAFAQTTSGPNTAPIKIAVIQSLSGPFSNIDEVVFRYRLWAMAHASVCAGDKLPGLARAMTWARYHSTRQNEEALSALGSVNDNTPDAASTAVHQAFRQRLPRPQDDDLHMRRLWVIEPLAQRLEKGGSTEALAVARQLERGVVSLAGHPGSCAPRATQFQQPLQVTMKGRRDEPDIAFDVEGPGYGFRVIRTLSAAKATLPTRCIIQRPSPPTAST